MNAEQFFDFCWAHNACAEGLAEIKGLSPAEWWAKTEHGDWMLWLKDKNLWAWSEVQCAEFNRITTAWGAEFQRAMTLQMPQFERMTVPAQAAYERLVAALWAQQLHLPRPLSQVGYEQALSAAWNEYWEITSPQRVEYPQIPSGMRAKYKAALSNTLRTIVGNPFLG